MRPRVALDETARAPGGRGMHVLALTYSEVQCLTHIPTCYFTYFRKILGPSTGSVPVGSGGAGLQTPPHRKNQYKNPISGDSSTLIQKLLLSVPARRPGTGAGLVGAVRQAYAPFPVLALEVSWAATDAGLQAVVNMTMTPEPQT